MRTQSDRIRPPTWLEPACPAGSSRIARCSLPLASELGNHARHVAVVGPHWDVAGRAHIQFEAAVVPDLAAGQAGAIVAAGSQVHRSAASMARIVGNENDAEALRASVLVR